MERVRMHIGFLLPSGAAVRNGHDGRLVQIQHQIRALRQLGHTVHQLCPWDTPKLQSLDVLHVVEGGVANPVGLWGLPKVRKFVLSPFLDTNAPMPLYRLLAWAGGMSNRLLTPQGVLRRQCLLADAVIARNRDEVRILRSGLGVPTGKIRLVSNGVDPPPPLSMDAAHAIRQSLGVPEAFAFHLSRFGQPRKNTPRLIRAAANAGIPLVLAGTHACNTRDLPKTDSSAQLVVLGELTPEQRTALYLTCRVFCLPSLYEGTGLVALEAAACGAPVLITRNGGPPDYFGPHATYVNPFSTTDITRKLRQLWDAPRTPDLQRHVLRNFTWEASARCLLDAYATPDTPAPSAGAIE